MRNFKNAASMFFLVSFFTGAIADTIIISGHVGSSNIATNGSTVINGGQTIIDKSKKTDVKIDSKIDNSKNLKIDNSRSITNNGSMTINGDITNK